MGSKTSQDDTSTWQTDMLLDGSAEGKHAKVNSCSSRRTTPVIMFRIKLESNHAEEKQHAQLRLCFVEKLFNIIELKLFMAYVVHNSLRSLTPSPSTFCCQAVPFSQALGPIPVSVSHPGCASRQSFLVPYRWPTLQSCTSRIYAIKSNHEAWIIWG